MGRTRQEIMESLSVADRAEVEARTAELHTEALGLKTAGGAPWNLAWNCPVRAS